MCNHFVLDDLQLELLLKAKCVGTRSLLCIMCSSVSVEDLAVVAHFVSYLHFN